MSRHSMLLRLMLVCATPLAEEVQIAPPPSPQAISAARAVLASSPQDLHLAIGEYEIVASAATLGQPLWISTDDSVVQTIPLRTHETAVVFARRRGEQQTAVHHIAAADRQRVIVVAQRAGAARLLCIVSSADQQPPLIVGTIRITVGSAPEPAPPPDPPRPRIRTDKLVVVIVHETNSPALPPEQAVILSSKMLRDDIAAAGGIIRVLDPDTDVSRDEQVVREIMQLPRSALPWLVVATPTRYHAGPLPATLQQVRQIIEEMRR